MMKYKLVFVMYSDSEINIIFINYNQYLKRISYKMRIGYFKFYFKCYLIIYSIIY